MTYATANRRPNAGALAGALGIPGGMAALLVVGLAVKVAVAPPEPPLTGETITETKLPPPPPPEEQQVRDSKPTNSTVITELPPRPSLPPTDFVLSDPIPMPGPFTSDGPGTGTGPVDLGSPGPTPTASLFDPVGAQPRNNPGRWVTNSDYRNRWILEEMAGTARSKLAIDARGKITECTITRSTGHAPLDAATCDLVTKRARFDAARDNTGKPVAGSYTGVITWQIPK